MSDTAAVRSAFAQAIRVAAGLGDSGLVEALAHIPRERFLGPGPWTVFRQNGATTTASDDPSEVYVDAPVAVDASRVLYNGQPSQIARWIDALALEPGARAVHIGCATGYFTALLAQMVGETGRVQAIEVDAAIAARARDLLSPWPWVDVHQGDGVTDLLRPVNALLVHAGATHLLPQWLDCLTEGGRMVVPLTVSIPGMPDTISKGVVLTATRRGDRWPARVGSMVAIYSLVGLRSATANQCLGEALRAGRWDAVASLRTDRHEQDASCWLHGESACLSRQAAESTEVLTWIST